MEKHLAEGCATRETVESTLTSQCIFKSRAWLVWRFDMHDLHSRRLESRESRLNIRLKLTHLGNLEASADIDC